MIGGLARMLGSNGWIGSASTTASGDVLEDGGTCSYTKVRRSECAVVQDPDSGKPVKRCERTQELLRRCSGRPVEVVESVTETTEEDLSNDLSNGHNDIGGIPGNLHEFLGYEEHLKFPELLPRLFGHQDKQSDLPFSGFDGFLHAAEEMASKVFEQFGMLRPDYGRDFSLFEDKMNREHSQEEEIDNLFSSGNHQQGSSKKEAPFAVYEKDFREI